MIQVYWHSNENMPEVEDGSVSLCLTSPHYPNDFSDPKQLLDYYTEIKNTLKNIYQKLRPDGFLVWENTDNYRDGTIMFRYCTFLRLIKSVNLNIFAVKLWVRREKSATTPDFSFLIFASKKDHLEPSMRHRIQKAPFCHNIWEFPLDKGENYRWKQYGSFPMQLTKRAMETFTNEGDLVLDPYMGVGTTLLMARSLNRNAVGYEIDPKLKPIYEEWETQTTLNAVNLGDF